MITLENFLEYNRRLTFFDEVSAVKYYKLIKINEIQTACMLVTDAIVKKYSWYEFNSILKLIPPVLQTYDKVFLEKLFDSRLDDFAVDIKINHLLPNLSGNYLISDIVQFNDITNEIELVKENVIFQSLALKVALSKNKFLDFIEKDISENKNNYVLGFTVRLLIYTKFLKFTNNERATTLFKIANSLLMNIRYKELKTTLQYLTFTFYNPSSVTFTRLNLMRDHTEHSYFSLLHNASQIDNGDFFSTLILTLTLNEWVLEN